MSHWRSLGEPVFNNQGFFISFYIYIHTHIYIYIYIYIWIESLQTPASYEKILFTSLMIYTHPLSEGDIDPVGKHCF